MAGRLRPVCADKLLRSSRAASESVPRSLNSRSGSMVVGSGWANTAAVVVVTRVVNASSRCSRLWPANCVSNASGPAEAATAAGVLGSAWANSVNSGEGPAR